MTALASLLPGPAEATVFATAVFVLNATPGVDFVLTVSRTLQGGPRAGAAAAAGIAAGCVVHALAAAFGLAALLAMHPQAFVAIQWAGAAYLAWLGLVMLRQAWTAGREGLADPAAATAPPLRTAWADFRIGLLTNVLNPKVAFFFLAFLPQFVPADSPQKTASFLLLGAWFVVQGLVFLLALVALAARLSRLQASGTARRLLGAFGGVLFLGLALRLLGARPAAA
ncbi:L-lysine permease [Rubrivivax sp. A210]|uniref:LysE family translocator n=1 Tax=Rubrivivax sp. A210 TaxID=2772301 RepID=UPI0019AD0640|nr:LysE family translocator [Rubrivivax sp. A210]CAD5374091.1 L-lysine permease [Rubrivivax sp. A210]